MRKRDYITEEEIKYERKERRKELEAYRDYVNAVYFGYANLPTAKEARHIFYMKYRDLILRYLKHWRQNNPNYMKIWLKQNPDYMKIWRQNNPEYFKLRYLMKKKKDYFLKKGFLNKHVKVHKCLE